MRWTGIIVGLFIIFHLADLTWGTLNGDFVRGDPYNNLVYSMQRLPIAILYVVANVALAIHIFHGAWSLFQSLGLNNPRFNQWRRRFAQGFAAVILVGNVSFPVLVTAGVIDPDPVERVKVCQERDELESSEACREAVVDVLEDRA
jgi:succinate dehydrogenase / fumarate reductase cytochrome b subunit